MKPKAPAIPDDDLDLPGPYDGAAGDDLWFLPEVPEEPGPVLPTVPQGALVVPESWRAAEAGLAAELSDLAFDAGRLRRSCGSS